MVVGTGGGQQLHQHLAIMCPPPKSPKSPPTPNPNPHRTHRRIGVDVAMAACLSPQVIHKGKSYNSNDNAAKIASTSLKNGEKVKVQC